MVVDLDSLIPADPTVRAVWAHVQRLDLRVLEDAIGARGSHRGRPAPDPRLLLALWRFAPLEGVGSARALERLCDSHLAYCWLRGGVSVHHHMLGEFRVESGWPGTGCGFGRARARVMTMADGGDRPACHVQPCTDTTGLVVVGVDVTTIGSDPPHLVSMVEPVERRVGVRPGRGRPGSGAPPAR